MHRTPPQCLWLLLPHFPNLCCQTNSAGISHTLKCNRNMISSASPSPLTFGFVRLLFCEFLHLVLLLEGRQNIMTSLLLYIFPMPRNRFHPPHALIAIYPYLTFSLQFITNHFLITKTWQQSQCASRCKYRPFALTSS